MKLTKQQQKFLSQLEAGYRFYACGFGNKLIAISPKGGNRFYGLVSLRSMLKMQDAGLLRSEYSVTTAQRQFIAVHHDGKAVSVNELRMIDALIAACE
jgi:hypothetical protein